MAGWPLAPTCSPAARNTSRPLILTRVSPPLPWSQLNAAGCNKAEVFPRFPRRGGDRHPLSLRRGLGSDAIDELSADAADGPTPAPTRGPGMHIYLR